MPKTTTITIRISPEQKTLIQQAADLDERSLSSYIVRAAVKEAKKTITLSGI